MSDVATNNEARQGRARAARESAVLYPRLDWGSLSIEGPDRLSWLNGVVTCDVSALKPGDATWGLALDRTGKIQSELWVLETAERTYLAAAPGTAEAVHTHLDRMLIMEDAELCLEPDWIWFSLWGPKAEEGARGVQSACSEPSTFRAPHDRLGLGGALLLTPRSQRECVLAAWGEQPLLDDVDWHSLRLERNVAEYGVDFTSQERPHEAALERKAVSWSKGCYLGQEVVCMQDMRGKVKRHLAVYLSEGPDAPEPAIGADVALEDGTVIGKVTSCSRSWETGRFLAMLMVQASAASGPCAIGGATYRPLTEPV